MKNKLLLMVVVILTIILLIEIKTPKKEIQNNKNNNNQEEIKVKNVATGAIETKDLENYVMGVVAAEMPASFSIEALKAQAIASRSYAYYKMKQNNGNYDIIADISNQAYINDDEMHEKWQGDYDIYYKKIKEAVDDTKNEVMTYDGQVIEAFYFAMSNGYTEDVVSVFGENLPYLKSVESKWDNNSLSNYEVNTQLSTVEFLKKLNLNNNIIVINNQIYDETGRTKEITINSTTFKGTEFRKLLNLRSTDFKIELENDIVNITTKGYGHGVGMSQYGANGMAKDGFDCYTILKYYYKDIEFQKL